MNRAKQNFFKLLMLMISILILFNSSNVFSEDSIPIDLSISNLNVISPDTIRIDGIKIPGIDGRYWATFRWNSQTYKFDIVDAGVSTVTSARIGDTIPEVGSETGKHNLSMTLIRWVESDIAVDGPYVGDEFYTFTAKPGMRFFVLEFEFHNNWVRKQETPYLNAGEVRTDKGYFYEVWSPPVGIDSKEYNPRPSTQEEVKSLGGSGAYEDLLPEESVKGHIFFEIPKDEKPIEIKLSQMPPIASPYNQGRPNPFLELLKRARGERDKKPIQIPPIELD